MTQPRTAILHYTAPPVVGGVEAVMQAHARAFVQNGYPIAILAGRGQADALPEGAELICLPEIDSRHPKVMPLSTQLEQGEVSPRFAEMTGRLVDSLDPVLRDFDHVIVHNVFTKHFNLPLTAALCRLLDQGKLQNCIAWCHDFTWTSPSSRSKVHPGYPWDLLRTRRLDVTYVVVSQQRQHELAALYGCSPDEVRVVYNGVDPEVLLGLGAESQELIGRLGLLGADLILLMPVRVTQAKNIEYALHVVAALRARGCRPKLVLTGPPDPHDARSMVYFRSLQELRQELGVEQEMRFVFESGPEEEGPYLIGPEVVGDLYRITDLMFMPSHREGFAMPVMEAGLAGIPVVCTAVPAAVEIGGQDLILFDLDESPAEVAERILAWAGDSPVHRLRCRVRSNYTWQAIFCRDIEPLLRDKDGAP